MASMALRSVAALTRGDHVPRMRAAIEWVRRIRDVLRGVSLRQLFSYSYGLDDSLLAVPRRARRFFDGHGGVAAISTS